MAKRSTKDRAFLDRFIKHWTVSSHNHPEGWRWWKKRNRKDVRRKIKKEGIEE